MTKSGGKCYRQLKPQVCKGPGVEQSWYVDGVEGAAQLDLGIKKRVVNEDVSEVEGMVLWFSDPQMSGSSLILDC